MAERRMFTKKITDDDNFVSLSSSAQALYLHLMMSADDDGFNNQVSISMFRSHASVADLEKLLEKRYLYQFDNGVIVIKHWRMANALRKDRYTPTTFQEEFKRLKIKENGAYTLNDSEWLPDGCQMVATGKDSIGKVSIGKDSIEKDVTASKDAKSVKHKYGEYQNVLLTDDELEKMKDFFPDWEQRIENLSSYIASKGAKYKSHYATIRNWARKDFNKPIQVVHPQKESRTDWIDNIDWSDVSED